jgi:hypothetical protein
VAAATTSSEPTAAAPPAPPLPSAGVYVYATTGHEGVDALSGSSHTYPEETTVTLTIGDDGCVHTRWDALRQRWNDETVCRRGRRWMLKEKTVFHSFFRQSERRHFVCDADSVALPARLIPDTTFNAACTSGGGSQSGRSTEAITGTVIGDEQLAIDGRMVDVIHIRYEMEIAGESSGHNQLDRWIWRDSPPLVVLETSRQTTTSETVIGDVHYDEDYELSVLSLEPRR